MLAAGTALWDDLIYRYEADVLTYNESAAWINGAPCRTKNGCIEGLEDGQLVLTWARYGGIVGDHFQIGTPDDPPPPPTLGVEWRFRSDQAFTGTSIFCDGRFRAHYHERNIRIRFDEDANGKLPGSQEDLG